MAQAQPTVDGDHTKTGTQARVFDATEPVALSDADVLKLVHGGGGGVVGEQHDSKAKNGEALETAANGAVGDNPVERADSVAVATGQAISGAVGQQAEAAEGANATASRSRIDDAIRKLRDPYYLMEYMSREDVQRDLAAFCDAIGRDDDISDWDEDQWRV